MIDIHVTRIMSSFVDGVCDSVTGCTKHF